MSFSAPGSPPPPDRPPYAAAAPYPAQPYPAQPYPAQPYPGQPVYPGPPPPRDVLRSPQGLATALTVLLSVAAAVNLFSAGSNLFAWSLMKDLIADPDQVADDTLDLSDMLTAFAGSVQLLVLLGTGTVFIIWFHRARVNGEIFRPDAFTQGRGWAIGAWFIPVGHLFLPYRTARQIWTASIQLGPDGSYRHVSTAPLTAWWVVWVVAACVDRVFAQMYKRAETPEALRDASAVGIVSDLIMVAAAVLAVLFVRKLTALQNTKAVQGPYAAV
ncbi:MULTISPECIES: DUF4328 domain-containing protein [unclassified Streptomyces]|uniref:DUF4328 domain-containing protein n=1 Tax=unclassified Streptomyces TaxID=2593676 RepID=UPI002256DAC9|nr:DUF4328 domain-containing protein [Streptomyces sp. NBC_00047]MCX5609584.1 DUF4328 domain-containing protein [Streptomyces sp. NBC_00047]